MMDDDDNSLIDITTVAFVCAYAGDVCTIENEDDNLEILHSVEYILIYGCSTGVVQTCKLL